MRRFAGITAFPRPTPSCLLNPPGAFAEAYGRYSAYFSSGRAAVYWAFRTLNLKSGSVAWLPDYHCGVEVQAALDAGLSVKFYRISHDLSVDVDDLEKSLKAQPGPVLLIHYFGFAQPSLETIARICIERQVPLIEDCAHALFSSTASRLLGSIAPIAVFSLRKTLPIHDGGALVTNRDVRSVRLSQAPVTTALSTLSKEFLRTLLGQRTIEAISSKVVSHSDSTQRLPEWVGQAKYYNQGQSIISQRLASRADPASIVNARRENWLIVHERLSSQSNHRAIWSDLAAGTCPLFYCFRVSKRDDLMRRLMSEQVETFRFGARPHPSLDLQLFAASRVLRDQIIGFPVHQRIRSVDLNAALDRTLQVLGEVGCA